MTKKKAMYVVLNCLRHPLYLMSRPCREEALALIKEFDISAENLLEYAIKNTLRNS